MTNLTNKLKEANKMLVLENEMLRRRIDEMSNYINKLQNDIITNSVHQNVTYILPEKTYLIENIKK